MRCVFCGGDVVEKNVTFVYENGDQLLVIRDVPAEVCSTCGEKTYSPQITDEIMQFAKQRFEPVKLIQVPVFNFEHKVVAAAA